MRRAMYDALNELKPKPEVWGRMLEVRILDADGWRDKDYEEPIVLGEYVARVYTSTVHMESGCNDLFDCEDFAREGGYM